MQWVDKHKPRAIADVVLNDLMKIRIDSFITHKTITHLILVGSNGVGKTLTVTNLVRDLYKETLHNCVLQLNASDDRGIRSVEETIRMFCKKKVVYDDRYAKHKVVILDEVENLSEKVQNLINELIDEYGSKEQNSTKFVFICNNITNILENIQSKCTILRFLPVEMSNIVKYLRGVCDKEKFDAEEEALEIIANSSKGDMRRAINDLQLVYNCFGEIITEYAYEICHKLKFEVIRGIFESCLQKKFKEAYLIIISLKENGFSEFDIITNMADTLKMPNVDYLEEPVKIKFLDAIYKTGFIMSQGIISMLQLCACLVTLCEL